MPLSPPRKAGLRAGRQRQVESCEIPLAGAPEILRVASRRIRSDFLPRLRAETSARVRRSKFSTQGVSLQADEGTHYGVQARRRDGEAAG